MKRLAGAALLASAVAVAGTMPASAHAAAWGESKAGQFLVVLKDGVDSEKKAKKHEKEHGAKSRHVYKSALRGYSAQMSQRARDRIARDPDVLWIEDDREVRATAQSIPTGIDRVDAELSPTANIDGLDDQVDVDVAVIDTGIDLDHPDLNVYRAGGKNCSLLGFLLPPDDDNGHGSHVAGTIGAKDNTTGVVGMAPGARLWPVKVLNSAGVGFTSDVVCGIDHVAANAGSIEVANMSLGGSGSDDGNCGNSNNDAQHRAICKAVAKGVTFVVAAGNSHRDAKDFVPAAYDEVITVSALADFDGKPGGAAAPTCRNDQDDTFADFSNFGADIDIIAPGVCINSTYLNGGYSVLSGTSMASPHVAGGAALYKATHPSASPTEVKAALQAAGSTDWTWPSQDRDGTQEVLLNVAKF